MTRAREPAWPSSPYKGLEYFSGKDRLLLSGRDGDIAACMRRLAAKDTRILMLYGQTGAGKSSFLRAGLVPRMEEQEFGYAFLSTRDPEDGQFTPYFVRCTSRPLDRLALAVFRFAQDPYFGPGRRGARVGLKRAMLGCKDESSFVAKCKQDPANLVRSIALVSAKAAATLIIIVDQAEEILTQTIPGDSQRQDFFKFLSSFTSTEIDVKLLLAIRTEHVAPFEDLFLARGLARTDVTRYQLRELTAPQLREAIYRPASNDPTPLKNLPAPPWGFAIQAEAADLLVKELGKLEGHGGTLPVMQIVCKDLFERLPGRKVQGHRKVDHAPQPPRGALARVRRLLNSRRAIIQERRRHRRGTLEQNIDLDLLGSAGGIAGRMADYLEDMIQRAHQALGEFADVEKWQLALLELVNFAPDGTASTQIVNEKHLNDLLDKHEIPREARDPKLEYLSLPSVRVLRYFEVLNEKNGDFERRYSLGHDALALGLKDWKSRRENRLLRERSVRLASWAAGFAVLALTVAGAAPFVLNSTANLEAARAAVVDAERAASTYPEISAAFGAEAARKIAGLDWIAKLIDSDTHLLAERLEMVIAKLPERLFPAGEGEFVPTFLLDAKTLIAHKDDGFIVGDPSDLSSARLIADYQPFLDSFYSARFIGSRLAFQNAFENMVFLDSAGKMHEWSAEHTGGYNNLKSIDENAIIYFEQDFLQYFTSEAYSDNATILDDDTLFSEDASESAGISFGVYPEIQEDLTVRPGPTSLGLIRYEAGTTPASSGDLYVGRMMVSWNGEPAVGRPVTLSIFDAFNQGDLFVSPVAGRDGQGRRILFSDGIFGSAGYTTESLNGEVTASAFGNDLPPFLQSCRRAAPSSGSDRYCTIQSSLSPVAAPMLLLATSPKKSEGIKGGMTNVIIPRSEDTPGCINGLCLGLLDIEKQTFDLLPQTRLLAKSVTGDPAGLQFVIGPAPNTGAGASSQMAIWSVTGEAINAIRLSDAGDPEKAPLVLAKWTDSEVDAAYFTDDGNWLLAHFTDSHVDRWNLNPKLGTLSLEEMATRFCEERKRLSQGILDQFISEMELLPDWKPENSCPGQEE
jgi:hypothetical protein